VQELFSKAEEGAIAQRSFIKRELFFTTMVMVSVGNQLVIDPTYEEMLISNNLLTLTVYPSGKHHLEKSLALRTFSTGSSSIQPLE